MTAYSTTADTGGFGWYHSWLLKDGTWDDDGWWADVAAWEANAGIDFGIGEAANNGVFTVVGQDAAKKIVAVQANGSFTLSGQDAFKNVSELAPGYFLTVGGQDINESLLEAIDFGGFDFTGQAANKNISEASGFGTFVFNGRPISEAISERAEAGVFSYAGSDVNEALLERIDAGAFTLSGQGAGKSISYALDVARFTWLHSWLLKDGVWDDAQWWVDAATWAPLDGINFGIGEAGSSGIFTLTGQDINEAILERIDFGAFTLSYEDGFPRKDRVERDNTKSSTIVVQSANSATFTHLPNRVIIQEITPNEAA